ncbi:protein phosphatase CheZ [uncultured Kiloniella sp.]|uniref:protein phosphatase CheZ n=1 Tax=uncultured Kiloniella sp. TaxID=1133091 RepID=UPI002635FA37|nr:protein phosphatase CheZ [uncultured Kiloniella sp.]
MTNPVREELLDKLKAFDSNAQDADLEALVDSLLQNFGEDAIETNHKLLAEIGSVASYIHDMKTQLASLRPDEIKSDFLPTAADELDAIVGATEQATHNILSAMETLEEVAGNLEADASDKVNDAVTQVYEACSFQDITGQRISRVVNALQHVEIKVDKLLNAFGGEEFVPENATAKSTPKRADGVERPDEDLLNGPQLPGEGVSQDDIDALMGFD